MLEAEADASHDPVSCSPVATPVPVALGNPGHGYPLPWAVQTWLPGQVASATALADSPELVGDLAAFIHAL
jgi:aminoglycoside phosphotransferase (APT) family kinase protein